MELSCFARGRVCVALVIMAAVCCMTSQINQFCAHPDGGTGMCVALKYCRSLYNLSIKHPEKARDVLLPYMRCELGLESKKWNNLAGAHLKVCCYRNKSDDLYSHPTYGHFGQYRNTCGLSAAQKIFGGIKTEPNEFPWMVAIAYQRKGSNLKKLELNRHDFFCGGTLISHRVVLTAAHCVVTKDLKLFALRIGAFSLDALDKSLDQFSQDIFLTNDFRIIHHEDYNNRTFANDIAVIIIPADIKVLNTPICLPFPPIHRPTGASLDVKMKVIGLGRTERSHQSAHLLQAQLPVIAIRDCYQALGSAVRSSSIHLDGDTQICAGGEAGVDSCAGDSGGPLMMTDENGKQIVTGVTSYGVQNCGQKGVPAVYTKVNPYLKWIMDVTNS